MTMPIFEVPLVPQSRYGDMYEMLFSERMRIERCKLGKSYYKTPVDEAVEAVREAQDACSKGIWEDK